MNQKGEEVIPFIYSSANSFHEGLAAVATGDYLNQKWSFIDKTGKTVLPFIFWF
ncbi:MAG: WG repeat-containing protein [Bacteroidia bacterium]|nr:WG repeat-containing protein [Bacteroidia bacterium]